MPVVRDGDLRSALSAMVERQYSGQRYMLVPEVDILVTYPGRIDALLIADRICGFEIKSDVDSLRRLPRQAAVYGPVLERATLVVGNRHAAAAEAMVPPWWGVLGVKRSRGELMLASRRRGRLNPAVDTFAVATFIPRDVIVRCLREHGKSGVSKSSISELRYLLSETISKTEMLTLARSSMLARTDWRYRAAKAHLDEDGAVYAAADGSAGSASCLETSAR